MTDDINKMSSAELAQAIKNVPIGESDQDFESSDYETDENELAESEPVEAVEEQTRRFIQEIDEEKAAEQRELEEEKREEAFKYLEGRIRESGGEEQFVGSFQKALMDDYGELRERYGPVAPWVDRFGDLIMKGKIRIKDEDMARFDNPHEHTFLEWIGKPSQMKELSTDEIRTVIEIGAKEAPLRSRVKAFARPSEMHPIPKAKPVRKKPTYKMPDISSEDFNEMLIDWSRKHPEKFR
jgi:hypothetical protein